MVLCVLAFVLVGAEAASAAATPHGLRATYFNDTAFRKPALTRTDARVAFNWKYGSPARSVGANTFSARWTGDLQAPKAGTYAISLRASDGVRLWIDGRRRINRWSRAASPATSSTTLRLGKGAHTIRIDYFESTGAATATLAWKGPGIRPQTIASKWLTPPVTKAPRVLGPGKPWSDPATWGGHVPAEGSSVTIPTGMAVLLDQDVALQDLTIEGSLEFARRDLTIESDWVVVHGTLQVGTEAAPFQQHATIRLRDRTPGENIMSMGDKTIGVMGGTLELHGAKRLGWTRLAATAAKGADRITLAKAPDWRPGDRIVLASTDFEASQAEEVTVTAVAGPVVTIDQPLKFTHYGVLQTLAGQSVDERGEVALLSHTITFEGEATSSAGGTGATIMVMDKGAAHVEGVELRRVGQEGILRRYPIHFHALGDAPGMYFRDSSVDHSFNRCATVHATNDVVVSGNVCYDHIGHGFFLEDGAEHDNVITGNLGMGGHKPAKGKAILPTDDDPATFWISNPDNVFRDNVAAGSEGPGFWIALPEHPTGYFALIHPAEAKAMWPRRTALTEFSGNTAHSNDGDGLHFDNGPGADGHSETTHHSAHVDPADDESKELDTQLTGFTAYKNRGEGAWLRGSNHHMVHAVLADNAIGATFASDESYLEDSLVVGETANLGTPERWEVQQGTVGRDGRSLPRPWDADFPVRGFEFYDGHVGVRRTTFVNFQPWENAKGERREQSGIGYKLDNDFSIDPKNEATAVRFVNARPVYLPTPKVGDDGAISSVFRDTDGSVTGTAGRSVMVLNPFLYGAGCAARTDWNAQVCTGDYASLKVGAPGHPEALRPVTITRPDGQAQTPMASTGDDADDANTTVQANTVYSVAFTGGTPAKAQFVLFNGRDRWVRIDVPRAEGFKVTRYGCNVGQAKSWCFGAAGSLAALNAAAKTGYWYDNAGDADPATGTLHLKVDATDADWSEIVVEPA
ncbi:MAG: transrane domain containing protein [Thermoleophilia bacterium]|nr:transrane domain containing protein [Thermoleophilia bacterium]